MMIVIVYKTVKPTKIRRRRKTTAATMFVRSALIVCAALASRVSAHWSREVRVEIFFSVLYASTSLAHESQQISRSCKCPQDTHLGHACTIPRYVGDLPLDVFLRTFKSRAPVVFGCRGGCAALNASTYATTSAAATCALDTDTGDLWSRLRPPVGTPSAALTAHLERDALLHTHGDALAILASSDSYSSEKRETTFADYVAEHVDRAVHPHTLAADSWYLFGDSQGMPHWDQLAAQYAPQPLDAASDNGLAVVGIGGRSSGVAFHTHGAAFAETLIGAKRWFLAAPEHKPMFDTKHVQANWTLAWEARRHDAAARAPHDDAILECTLGAGEVIYIPSRWWHATLNLGTWNAFVSTFTQERAAK